MKNIEIIKTMVVENLEIYVIEDFAKQPLQAFFKIDQSPKKPIFCTIEFELDVENNILSKGNDVMVHKAKILNSNTGDPIPHKYIAIKADLTKRFNLEKETTTSDPIGKPTNYLKYTFLPLDLISGTPEIINKMIKENRDIYVIQDSEKKPLQVFFRIDQSPKEPIFCTIDFENEEKGCDLHLMSSFPDNDIKAYRNSYILVRERLRYISFTGEYERSDVPIRDIGKFLEDIKSFNLVIGGKVRLSDDQAKNLITLNGGHAQEKNTIGKGSYGTVFKAKILNSNTGDPVPHEYIAIKAVLKKQFKLKEHTITSDCMATGKPINYLDYTYLPLDFISGKPMGDEYEEQNLILRGLSDEEKLNLAIDFLDECKEMHMKRVHGDLKGGNILLQKLFNNQNKRISKIRIIDWGFAFPVGEGKTISKKADSHYHPPEAKNGIWGVFTDIYMMAGVLGTIFGYHNNYGSKNSAIFETQFTPNGLKHLDFEKFIIVSMIKYLNIMRHKEYDRRPDKNSPIQFFLLLKELSEFNQLPKEKQNLTDFRILKTKIYLLTSTNWTHPSNQLSEEYFTSLMKNSSCEEIRKSFEFIWTSTPTPLKKITDQKNIGKQETKSFFMITRHLGTLDNTLKMLTMNIDDPRMAMEVSGYPVEYYGTYEQALTELKALETSPNFKNIILEFHCPINEKPGKEHIKKENVVNSTSRTKQTSYLISKNEEKNNVEIKENKLDNPKDSESKKSTPSRDQLNNKYKKIVEIIVRRIKKLPEYKGNDAKQILILQNENQVKKYETGSRLFKGMSSLVGRAPKLQVQEKSLSPHMEKIYSMAVALMTECDLHNRFGHFREQVLLQIKNMEGETSLTFFKTTTDYHISLFIRNLLEPTKEEEMLVKTSENHQQSIHSIWTPVPTDQKNSSPQKQTNFFMITRYEETPEKTFYMLTVNADNPEMAMSFGYPEVKYYQTYEEALNQSKTLNPKFCYTILGFHCPNGKPGKEHIKRDNLFDPRNPQSAQNVSSSLPNGL